MKKHLIIVVFLLLAIGVKAQKGEIRVVDFMPDSVLIYGGQPSQLMVDFDNDGIQDIRMYWFQSSGGGGFSITGCHGAILLCKAEEEDTLSHLTGWWYELTFPERHETWGFRIEKDGNCYYGWFRTYWIPSEHSLWFDKYAYCTIPNYPLVWGQTDLTNMKEESKFIIFSTLHPNPTNGMVTITGENLQQAEVFNMLGQKVLSVQGKGDELRIDMATLPAGIYFVTVTNEEGRKCARKVVKE